MPLLFSDVSKNHLAITFVSLKAYRGHVFNEVSDAPHMISLYCSRGLFRHCHYYHYCGDICFCCLLLRIFMLSCWRRGDPQSSAKSIAKLMASMLSTYRC